MTIPMDPQAYKALDAMTDAVPQLLNLGKRLAGGAAPDLDDVIAAVDEALQQCQCDCSPDSGCRSAGGE